MLSTSTAFEKVPTGLDYGKKTYLTYESLTPISADHENVFRQVLKDIKSIFPKEFDWSNAMQLLGSDWQKQFEAMDNFRRFLKFHRETIQMFSFAIPTITDEV